MALLLIMPMKVMATKYDEDATFRNSGPIKVLIYDLATGGCWTNIKEVRDYVIGQVEVICGEILPAGTGAIFVEDINIEVTVHAIRHPQSKVCFGNISLDVWTLAEAYGNRELFGHLYLSTYSKIVHNPKNLNIPVLDLVKEALQEW